MQVAQTLIAGAVAIGMVTALLLPGRQTPAVLKALQNLIQGTLRTSITGK
jgi:hypothetical protein